MAPDIEPVDQTQGGAEKPRKRAKASKLRLLRWARNRFFTGVIVALPIMATFLAVSWIVTKIDANVFRILPGQLNPQTYLGFAVPGLGLIISIIVLFLLGIIASNFIGKSLIKSGENLLGRVPVVSSVYNSLKQIVQTVADQKDRAFRDVCPVSYTHLTLPTTPYV